MTQTTSRHRRWTRAALTAGAVAALAVLPATAAHAAPAAAATATSAASSGPIQPVAKVDVARYLGTWHQLADIPQFYETFCQKATTAHYALNADGTVAVNNTCTGPFNSTITANGAAEVLDPGTNAQLQVSFLNLFGTPIFTGNGPNYVIIGLASDYSWAVVGSPDHSSGYVLARATSLTASQQKAVNAALTRSGYAPNALTPTKQ